MKDFRYVEIRNRRPSPARMATPRKTVLAGAIAAALAASSVSDVSATTFRMQFSGAFTMLNQSGGPVANSPSDYAYNSIAPWYGNRTPFTGVMTYDDVTETGTILNMSGTFAASGLPNGFFFFEKTTPPATMPPTSNLAVPSGATTSDPIPFSRIGNGMGGAGNLLLGNILFTWNNLSHSVPIVWDATGMLGNLVCGPTVQNVGAVPASDAIDFDSKVAVKTFPLGPSPIATTTFNTTDTGNFYPDGTTPVIADTIAGSPMNSSAFGNFNASFDITSITMLEIGGTACSQAPVINSTTPVDGGTGFNESASPTITFSIPMNAATVAAAGNVTLTNVATSTLVPATITPATGNTATTFTVDPTATLDFSTQYRVNVTTNVQAANGQALATPFSFTFTTRPVPPADTQFCPLGDQRPDVPDGSNFTMLNASGDVVGGTNDVTYTLDFGNLNTVINGTIGLGTNVLRSENNHPFFGNVWTAHHIRLFGPGTWVFNTACTGDELVDGKALTACAIQGPTIQMTVGTNQVGAHMLFDWSNSSDIDVLNVWNPNGAWNDPDPGTPKNDIYTGDLWAGPAGLGVDPDAAYDWVSTDDDGNGVNGIPMGPKGIPDGTPPFSPFAGFNANFNLSPDRSCVPIRPASQQAPQTALGRGFFGCSLTNGKVEPWQRADLGVLAGFLAALAFWRRRNRNA